MICVNAFYPAAGEGRFDIAYYYEQHIPLCQRLLGPFGLRKIEVDEGISGVTAGAPPNYRAIARLYFDRLENFQEALAAAGHQILSDVPNYTDIPIEFQVSKTVSF
jgi:uncharacterized protein (TIGR02118 family)